MRDSRGWFLKGASAPAQVFCFPYAAGGAAVYFPYLAALAPDVQVIAVRLPGRETRLGEAPQFDLDEVTAEVAGQIRPPYALLGHSMGAQVALEVAAGLAARGAPPARSLLALGCPAPCEPATDTLAKIESSTDAELIEFLRGMGGMPAEALAEPVLVELMLPTIRADLTWVAAHYRTPAPILTCPVFAVAGAQDRQAPPASMRRWAAYSTGPFSAYVLPGGHFFIHDQVAAVAALVRAALA